MPALAPTARRAADCLLLALLVLLVIDPPGPAAMPLCAGLAWLFAWSAALPWAAAHAAWPAGAGGVATATLLLAAARPWALPLGWPVGVLCVCAGVAATTTRRWPHPGWPAGVAGLALAADALALPGLYPSLHLALAVLAWLAGAAALHRLLPSPIRGALPLHVAGAACLIAAFLPAASSPDARRALRGRSAIGEKLLLVAWSATDLDGDGRSHLFGGGDPDALTPTPAWRPAPPPTGPAPPPLPPRPVLVISADSLRADAIGATTPMISALATRARVFERAYAEVPATVPSFQAMLRGGVCGPARAVLPGRAHLRPVFEAAGVQVTESEELAVAIAAVGALATARGLTWIHRWAPHAPYPPPGATPRRRYENGVASFDADVGALLQAAPADAAVIVTSDHGEAFGEHGMRYHRTSVYDEQVRVPLIIRSGAGAAGRVTSAVGLRDLGPTLRHLLGCPGELGGASLIAELAPAAERPPIHLRTLRLEGEFGPPASMRGVVFAGFKLVHRVGWNLSELYDLGADPGELTDLAPQRPDHVRRLLALP